MYRNLDLTALRSFVAVAELGGVTRAASKLHLTQSAVSMQIKRMEQNLDQTLLKRVGRTVELTGQGEQLLGYGRRMVALNDEAWGRLTCPQFEGEITFGVPYDIIYPHIPNILREFNAAYPRVKVRLKSSNTCFLKERFAAGVPDIILTTELPQAGKGDLLCVEPLVWYGARGGKVWRRRPLPISFDAKCIFRQSGLAALDAEGIPWEYAVDSTGFTAFSAFISADIAIVCALRGSQRSDWTEVPAEAGLPALPEYGVFQYVRNNVNNAPIQELATMVRTAYSQPALPGGKGPAEWWGTG